MYELNTVYFKELCLYIIAGKKKLNIVRETDLAALAEKAKAERAGGGRAGGERPAAPLRPF